jgi:putative ABC transport system permease protein
MRELFLSLKYARRELRAGLKGFYIFLACLVLGTAAITGVQSLSRGLIDSLHHDGRFILGGDIALRTVYEPATPEQTDFLRRKMKAVLSIVMETRAMARRTDGTRAALIELKAVDPFYPLYGRMEFADGTGKPMPEKVPQDMIFPVAHPLTGEKLVDRPGAAVEKELLSRLDLKVGDEMMLGKTRYLITGVITKEPDRLSGRGFALAPRVMISGYSVEEAGLAAQGAQVYYDHRLLLPLVRTLDDILAVQKQILAAFP